MRKPLKPPSSCPSPRKLALASLHLNVIAFASKRGGEKERPNALSPWGEGWGEGGLYSCIYDSLNTAPHSHHGGGL